MWEIILPFICLLQRGTPVQKDTDHFTEEEKKVSCMQQQLLLQHYADHKLTTWSRDLESRFLVICSRIFPHFMKTKYSLPCPEHFQ
jgi:hypothetical protein